jgi:glycosyltransferase involved in cell wall biosynthesis
VVDQLMKGDTPAFSVVVPVHNESESIDELVVSIQKALASLRGNHEVIFVDDGSTDDTLEKLKCLARTHHRVRVFSFRRNLGKSLALECGFRMAAGEYILTLDADLQDDPGELQHMYEHLTRERADMVSGWRRQRRDSVLKVASSKIFNLIVVRMLFGASFKDMNSGLKLYKAEVARGLQLYGGMHRFIPLIVKEMGYRVAEVPVSHHARKYGSSKYRSTKILTEIPDLLTVFFLIKYTRKPLHFFGRIGSALFVVGLAFLLYLTFLWTQGIPIGTRPLLIFGALLVLVGGQIVFTGLLADLIVNINPRKQDLPLRYASDEEEAPVGQPTGYSENVTRT